MKTVNDEIGYESNPYLILYSPRLKSTMKPVDAVGLLDPPQDESKIRVRLSEVERLKDDVLAVMDYERRHYNSKLGEVKAGCRLLMQRIMFSNTLC